MPTITIDLSELREMVGPVSIEELVEVITQLKGEVKGIEGDELTVELEPDRPDILSVEGLARALKGYLEIEPGLHESSLKPLRDSGLTVKVINAKVRPYIACAVVKGLKLDDRAVRSLMRMQEVLHLTLGRNRRKVAIGFHDLKAIHPPIIYTEAKPTDTMIPLDMPIEMSLKEVLEKHPKGIEFKHLVKGGYPVYVDKQGIFSFPPIINSERTRVTEESENLFIELTGIDAKAVKQTLNIIAFNLIDRGGEVELVKVEYENRMEVTPNLEPRKMKVNLNEISNLIGIKLDEKLAKRLLAKMRYGISKISKSELEVLIPAYRVDVMHMVDIAEDIAIAYGYANLTPELPNIVTVGKPSIMEILEAKIRQSLIGLGLQEVMTFTLSGRKLQAKLMNLDNLELVEIENPITLDLNVYRRWITPHLMRFLSQNKHVAYPQKIFEIGYVAVPVNGRIEVLRNTAAAVASSKATFTEIQGILQALAVDLGVNFKLKKWEHPSFIPGRTAAIIVNGEAVGIIGEIHPQVLNNFELEVPVVAFEITHYKPTYPNSREKPKSINDKIKALWMPTQTKKRGKLELAYPQ
ncbi:MAG: phenylalanine--tRNA ligase subunit beta [Candidatus Methanomethylicota archaeon]|uniref:Phenylalanine--tRNA ligase beta subunit n=1 Tax=Thermoproteota archaeon TaxID=2056631 RepID=A0A497F2B0_9CREN|nr:MAG: phenylalanine--tRNA ligase subunit beta [Candidatus Verstraetearchaeota archaeon]